MLFGLSIGRAKAAATGPEARAGEDRQARLISRIKRLSSRPDATVTARTEFGLDIPDEIPDQD